MRSSGASLTRLVSYDSLVPSILTGDCRNNSCNACASYSCVDVGDAAIACSRSASYARRVFIWVLLHSLQSVSLSCRSKKESFFPQFVQRLAMSQSISSRLIISYACCLMNRCVPSICAADPCDLLKTFVHFAEVYASNRLMAIEQALLSNGGSQLCVRDTVLQRQIRFHKRCEVIGCFD